jgi:hypothetical protein
MESTTIAFSSSSCCEARQACHLALVLTDTLEFSLGDLVHELYSFSEETGCGDSSEPLTVVLLGESDDEGDDKSDGDRSDSRDPVIAGDVPEAEGLMKRIRLATDNDDILQQIIV